MTRSRPKVHIHLDYGKGLARWREQHQHGTLEQRSPYGYEYARHYADTTYSDDVAEGPLGSVTRRASARILGFDLIHAIRNLRVMRRADVIWTHTERELLAVALLRRFGFLNGVRVVGQTVWLWDLWSGGLPSWRRRCFAWLLSVVDVLTTLSPENAKMASEVLAREVHFVPFGVDCPFDVRTVGANRAESGSLRVVAPGSDRHRDWHLLASVARANPDMDVTIVSRSAAARAAAGPDVPNLAVVSVSETSAMSDMVAAADVIAIPLTQNLHASGVTVALEALAAGAPLAVTQTGGLDAYLGEFAEYAPVGDAEKFAAALRRAARLGGDEEAAARVDWVVDAGLTAEAYAMRHLAITNLVLQGGPSWRSVGALKWPREAGAVNDA